MAHLTTEEYLNRANIAELINELCNELVRNTAYFKHERTIKILIAGGSAIALRSGQRNTCDIDADIKCSVSIRDCITRIAKKHNIPADWINQDFTSSPSYSRYIWDDAILIKRECNRINNNIVVEVYIISELSQLCLKAVAGRRKDMRDIKSMLVIMCQNSNFCYSMYARRMEELYANNQKAKMSAESLMQRMCKRLGRYK